MDAPGQLQSAANGRDDLTIIRREGGDESVIAVDFGRGAEVALDTLGETVIVVAGDRQIEFEMPEEATDLSTNNGILTIRG